MRNMFSVFTAVIGVLAGASVQAERPIPEGFMNAARSEVLMVAWTDKSLWIPNPPIFGGGTCFEFRQWENCRISVFDANMRMKDAKGRLCQLKEYIATDEPGMKPGEFGLIVSGIGTSFNYGFPQVIQPGDTRFSPGNREPDWEISAKPCSERAK